MVCITDCADCIHSRENIDGWIPCCDAYPDGMPHEFNYIGLKMKKECNSDNHIGFEDKEYFGKNTEELAIALEKDIHSRDANTCMYAIKTCVMKNIITDVIINRLMSIKNEPDCYYINIVSNYATAALDIIGVEAYSGNKPSVLKMINTKLEELF